MSPEEEMTYGWTATGFGLGLMGNGLSTAAGSVSYAQQAPQSDYWRIMGGQQWGTVQPIKPLSFFDKLRNEIDEWLKL